MRTDDPQMSITSVPAPGTTEAVELGCTCRFIAHEAATPERELAGMLIDPDLDCPLHGTAVHAAKLRRCRLQSSVDGVQQLTEFARL